MTCKELGGPCEKQLTARSWEEMVRSMTVHVMNEHPQTAKDMEQMHKQDPKKWAREKKPKWDARPET